MSFSFFQISNDYCQKPCNQFRGFLLSSTASQIFLIYAFLTVKLWPFYFFFCFFVLEICKEMHFVSLFFLNERNITTSLLMIHLKSTTVQYLNLNSSSINNPLLNYWPLNMLFCFFDFLFMFVLTRLLSRVLGYQILWY